MRSSNNVYLSNLDHLRAFAAYMVFIWHFVHFMPACEALAQCDAKRPVFTPFFSLLDQGYSGVALFMCISGYIFPYLTYDKKVHFGRFWQNRFLRLFPLMLFWGITESLGMIDDLIDGKGDRAEMLWATLKHILHPQGAWTIYIELQYYIALPLILLGIRRFGPKMILWGMLALLVDRIAIWAATGSVQYLGYWTILGHGDQFLLGTAAFYLEQHIKRSDANPKRRLRLLGLCGLLGIMLLYEYVQYAGGLHEKSQQLSPDPLWIFLPAIEGACYSLIVIAYLQCSVPQWLDRPLSAMGRWSYSIYLDHFQLVPFLYVIATTRFGMADNFYVKLFFATFVVFPLLLPYCALTYAMIEKPFLRLRSTYIVPCKIP